MTEQMICAEEVATVIQQNGCSGAMAKLGPLVLLKYDRRLELPRPVYQWEFWVHNKLNSESQLSRDPLVVLVFFGGWGRREYVSSSPCPP